VCLGDRGDAGYGVGSVGRYLLHFANDSDHRLTGLLELACSARYFVDALADGTDSCKELLQRANGGR
jgi:hypothetical protein